MNSSHRALLLVVVGLAIVCASLAYSSPVVGDIYYTLGLLVLGLGTVAAICFRGKRRAFWIGFAVLFGFYFYTAMWPTEIRNAFAYVQRVGGGGFYGQGLITTRLLAEAYEGLHPTFGSGRVGMGVPRTSRPDEAAGKFLSFLTIGHTVFALALGIGGGLFARRIAPQTLPLSNRPLETILSEMDIP